VYNDGIATAITPTFITIISVPITSPPAIPPATPARQFPSSTVPRVVSVVVDIVPEPSDGDDKGVWRSCVPYTLSPKF
jgi:hypothetical protein